MILEKLERRKTAVEVIGGRNQAGGDYLQRCKRGKTGVNEKMQLQYCTSLVLSILYHAGYYGGNE